MMAQSAAVSALFAPLLLALALLRPTDAATTTTKSAPPPPPSIVTLPAQLSPAARNNPSWRRLKILVNSPAMGWSHSKYQGSLADALVDAGHEVHMFTYEMNAFVGNFTGSAKAHKVYRHERPSEKRHAMQQLSFTTDQFSGPMNLIFAGVMQDLTRLQTECCEEYLANKELLRQLEAEHYDFGISEIYDLCPFGLFHKIGIKSMAGSQAVSLNAMTAALFGIPTFSSTIFGFWTFPENPHQMTFVDRFRNFYIDVFEYMTCRDLPYNLQQPLFNKEFGPDFPSLKEISKNVSLVFVNNNEYFAQARPLSPKIVYVGGLIGEHEPRTLEPKFKSIIDGASEGVVLFTLGTYADTRHMSTELRSRFFNAFARFPNHEFIVKYTPPADNATFDVPPNVHIFDWVNQRGILAHPRTRLFISHCGMNSANEVAYSGVPVVAIPLFGDQFYNADMLKVKGAGVVVDIRSVKADADVLPNAIRRVLSDRRFADAAELMRRKLALNPFRPSERLVKMVEFAAEFDDLNELNMPRWDEMSLFTFYSLDVIAVSVALLLAALGTTALLLKWAWTCGVQALLADAERKSKKIQ